MLTKQDKLLAELRALVGKHGSGRPSLIPILMEVQEHYGQISDFTMQAIADMLGIHPVEVYSVVTFYAFLNEKYHGKFVIRLCRTISCDMAGKKAVARQLENDLGIEFGETTEDGRFTLEWANCIGMCDQGPAMLVNDQVFTHVTPEKVHDILEACRRSFGPSSMQKEGIAL
ncbi:MAG: NADH-quinone oxidoreductase subunit NuoE [Candidatus Krumholzibacteriota bacterium]|nr:NADH-quinone oxidoreductase subunit NuoE [Candidatus Krumholzibacteriota bacterium]